VERNLNFQKTCCIFCISIFNDRCLRAPVLSNKLLRLKRLLLDRTVDIVPDVTSNVVTSLLGDWVSSTSTFFIKTFDVKLP